MRGYDLPTSGSGSADQLFPQRRRTSTEQEQASEPRHQPTAFDQQHSGFRRRGRRYDSETTQETRQRLVVYSQPTDAVHCLVTNAPDVRAYRKRCVPVRWSNFGRTAYRGGSGGKFLGAWSLEGVDCRKKNKICGQLWHSNVSSRSPLPSYRIKTLRRDYLYRWQNSGGGSGAGRKLCEGRVPRTAPDAIVPDAV